MATTKQIKRQGKPAGVAAPLCWRVPSRSFGSFGLGKIALTLFLAAAGARAAEPVRIGLQYVYHTRAPKPRDTALAVVSLFFRERLEECPSLRLVDDLRTRALFTELRGGVSHERYARLLKVDVLIYYAFKDDDLLVYVARKGRTTSFRIRLKELAKGTREAARFVAGELQLSKAETQALTARRIKDPGAFVARYSTRNESMAWPLNSGEARLKKLGPHVKRAPNCVLLQAAVLEDAGLLLGSKNRKATYHKSGLGYALQALPHVIGTEHEPAAHQVIKLKPVIFEHMLLEMAAPLLAGDVDEMIGDLDLDEEEDEELVARAKTAIPPARSRGALRLLGVMASAKGLPRILRAAKSEQAPTRAAAAYALQFYPKKNAAPPLTKLVADKNVHVGFMANFSLNVLGRGRPEKLLPLARQILRSPKASVLEIGLALDALTKAPAKNDFSLLGNFAHHRSSRGRNAARLGQRLILAGTPARIPELLRDVDSATVLLAIARLPKHLAPQDITQLKKLAQSPYSPVADAAVLALAPHRPGDPRQARRFDLDIAHTYFKLKVVDELGRTRSNDALTDLEYACGNADPYTRAYALKTLASVAAQRARPLALKALTDPHAWVRLHSAAIIAERAVADDAARIRQALAKARDLAERLYLQGALAKATGQAQPPARKAARSVAARKNMTWLCGAGRDAVNSPFTGYYQFRTTPSDLWKKAYAKGKIFFCRTSTVGHPGLISVSRPSRDSFWRSIDAQLSEANLPYIDGLVFGEESMSMKPDSLWPEGWRLFCRDAGIDATRVKGDLGSLNPYERRAWTHWALARTVEGFNILYDYVKLKYGKLRPGLQVCTFLPEQGLHGAATPPNIQDWNFDVGGNYHYKGDSRMAAYNLTRRYRTFWPDRPVLWLSLGIGGYEMNPVKRTLRVPKMPLMHRSSRCYADTVTAWIAGADPGWFSVWIFVAKNFRGSMSELSGVQVGVEDIGADSPTLKRAIEYAFRGVENELEIKALGKPTIGDAGEAWEDEGDDGELEDLDADEKQAAIEKEIETAKERFRRGFLFYQQYVYDCVRIFASLPRRQSRPQVLAVRPNVSVWTRPPTRNPLVPGMALLNSYDFICDLNQASRLELSRYRLIVVHDPGSLQDATIAALSKWLRETPGLLYVHRKIAAENTAEASTPEDHDGKLQNDWPWENDLTITRAKGYPASFRRPRKLILEGKGKPVTVASAVHASTLRCKGAARPLYSVNKETVLAVWRRPGAFKGAVLFDGLESASKDYLNVLRQVINQIHKAHGVGLELSGPMLHVLLDSADLRAAAASRYYRAVSEVRVSKGLDFLTGESDPKVGGGASAMISGEDYISEYIASGNGITALADKPFRQAKKSAGGLVLHSDGLVRVATASGKLKVQPLKGKALPRLSEEEALSWLLFGKKSNGLATFIIGKKKRSVTYFRSRSPVKVLPVPGNVR